MSVYVCMSVGVPFVSVFLCICVHLSVSIERICFSLPLEAAMCPRSCAGPDTECGHNWVLGPDTRTEVQGKGVGTGTDQKGLCREVLGCGWRRAQSTLYKLQSLRSPGEFKDYLGYEGSVPGWSCTKQVPSC